MTVPSQDMVFGVYYLTSEKTGEALSILPLQALRMLFLAIEANRDLDLQAKVVVRVSSKDANAVGTRCDSAAVSMRSGR